MKQDTQPPLLDYWNYSWKSFANKYCWKYLSGRMKQPETTKWIPPDVKVPECLYHIYANYRLNHQNYMIEETYLSAVFWLIFLGLAIASVSLRSLHLPQSSDQSSHFQPGPSAQIPSTRAPDLGPVSAN